MNVLHYNNASQSFKTFKRKALAEKTDIVHIHVCWSWTAWQIMRWCRKNLKPVVFSPEKQLMPWHTLHRYWLCKLPKLLIFQKWMIRQAHAIVAVTPQEQQYLLSMGLYPTVKYHTTWNDRVVYDVPQEILYQKVIDSHSFMVMTAEEKSAESTLLRLGLSQDEDSRRISPEQEEQVKSLTPESWRKLLLHADEEGILQEIRQGASLLQIAPQTIADIERFATRGKKNNQPLEQKEPLLKPLHMQEYAEEKHAGKPEIQVLTAILNLIHELQKDTISRRHLADLYTTLRFTDYNEKKVREVLALLKLDKTTARLLQILHETLGLEEGFMLMEARNDRGTRKLRKKLYEANVQ